jgi:hypothetical protein
MSFLKAFPSREALASNGPGQVLRNTNGHIHSPYSFSAFRDIDQIFAIADREGIEVLGINDFIVTDGYQAFHDAAVGHKVFPMFNIEFMALLGEEQKNGIRVNDPNNPGRTYFSGKGLDYPAAPPEDTADKLRKVKEESNRQTREMCAKMGAWLREVNMPFGFGFEEIQRDFAQDLVRERHLAKALRVRVYEYFPSEGQRREAFNIICGKPVLSALDDHASVENELRSYLLKSGGVAFVEEDPEAFLDLDVVIDLIRSMGGIPCYPVLLDDSKGNITEFEADPARLYEALTKRGIYALELIPGRNDFDVLKKFVGYFSERRFVITFGTEHNTPALEPLTVSCRGGVPLDDDLMKVANEGCQVIAAHQYLRAKGGEGYLSSDGTLKTGEYEAFAALGNAVIDHFQKH